MISAQELETPFSVPKKEFLLPASESYKLLSLQCKVTLTFAEQSTLTVYFGVDVNLRKSLLWLM